MSSTNKQLRDGILRVMRESDGYAYGATSEGSTACFRAIRDNLRDLLNLEWDTPAAPHPDTARLDLLLQRLGTWDREKIDAAMRPATKYRPWTQDEGHGKVVRPKGAKRHFTISETTPEGCLINGNFNYWGPLLRDCEQPDGSPCGVEVRE